MFDLTNSWYSHAGAGHWPDADMIPIGKLSKRGPVGAERWSNLTNDEKYTMMTLWIIARSPLIWGGNLVENRAEELKLMQNSEAIAVNQNSTNNKPVVNGTTPIWCADVPGTRIKYVAVFNRNSSAKTVTINFNTLGITTDSDTLRDLWAKNDVGVFSGSYSVNLAAHQSKLYRITPPGATMVSDRKAILGNISFVTRIRNGNIILTPQSNQHKFSVSIYTPGGQLLTSKDGTGSMIIPVRSKGVYLIDVNCNGHIEKKKVSLL